MRYPVTTDGRYFVVRGRLWRCSNPAFASNDKERLTHELMAARRAKQTAMRRGNAEAREAARARIDAAKVTLGERGAVWWDDGAPDLNRKMARAIYDAAWFASLSDVGKPDADYRVRVRPRRGLVRHIFDSEPPQLMNSQYSFMRFMPSNP